METASLAGPHAPAEPRDVPRVSIILITCGQPGLLLRSLTTLARLDDELGFEVVVVENGTCAQTAELLSLVEGDLQRIRRDVPVERAVACDTAASSATGQYLCFLREDTVPVDGWLAPLVAALDDDPRLGAAIARAAAPSGQVLEESHWAAIAIRKAAFDEVGGFGGSSQPLRWEGATLLEAICERGWTLATEPSSVVLLQPTG
jgi:glycosyltransferase involved in cell wall biosynthesis